MDASNRNPYSRRQADHFQRRLDELHARLEELNRLAHLNDQALDAELRAIHASLPHYKEALALELAKRKRSGPAARAKAGK